MDISRDYLPSVKMPIAVLFTLFVIQTLLVLSIEMFTDLAKNIQINTLVIGGIYFAFTLCAWEIIAWAGIRTARATRGDLIDGAIGGVITAVVAGFMVRLVSILFKVSTLPIVATAPAGGSAAAAWIVGFLSISLDVLGMVVWFFIDLIGGAVFGGLGGFVHKRRLLDQMKIIPLKPANNEAGKIKAGKTGSRKR